MWIKLATWQNRISHAESYIGFNMGKNRKTDDYLRNYVLGKISKYWVRKIKMRKSEVALEPQCLSTH